MTSPPPKSTAVQIAADVAAGTRSARSVIEEHLAHIAAHDDAIGAFNLVTADQALEQADAIDAAVAAGKPVGPLAGVPLALKDNLCTKGIPTTCSSKMLEGWHPPYDATAVKKARAADAVIIGKTNLDEFAMGSSTENSAFGPTRNPHDLSKVPGGSSGGSTAAVAADFAPLALGSDTGGSVRQPAALCGVVGLKPTYGRVSRYGLVAFASSLDQIGPIAGTVADTAALFEAIAGYDPLDSTSLANDNDGADATSAGTATTAGTDTSTGTNTNISGLRVGVIAELSGTPTKGVTPLEGMAADVLARTKEAIAVLESSGAHIDEVSVPSVRLGLSAYYLIAPAEASSNLARYDGVRYGNRVAGATSADMQIATRNNGFGEEVKRRVMLGTYALSAGYYDAFYGTAQRVRTIMLEEFANTYENFDVLICPTTPTTAFDLDAKMQDPLAMYLNDICTIPSNLTGHPAISVPFGTGDDGLPVGVQIMGPALSEARLLQVAAILESAGLESDGLEAAAPATPDLP